jgi:hypothetical protein
LWHIQIIGTGELFSSLLRHFRRTAGWKLPENCLDPTQRKASIILLISTMPWPEIFGALREINLQGALVMES